MSDIKKTQQERSNDYGDYKGGCILRSKIMKLINKRYGTIHGNRMPRTYEVFIWDVVNKLSRLAVTPTHIDSWHDLSSYANLAESVLKGDHDAHKQLNACSTKPYKNKTK